MNVWTCEIRCDFRGCMNQVAGGIATDSYRLADQFAQKEAIHAGWDIGVEDGTSVHRCPEHRRKP